MSSWTRLARGPTFARATRSIASEMSHAVTS
jgi:hypothetical protein